MAKAYDRIDWEYIEAILQAMGFYERWIQLVGACVRTVQYKIVLNDELLGPIHSGRGLRHHDPLSPYLFVIGAEGLSMMLKKREDCGDIHGCAIAKGAPHVSHLFFADDSYLFFKVCSKEAGVIRTVLDVYKDESRLDINFTKSSAYFSRNVGTDFRVEICNKLGVAEDSGSGKYLGMPILAERRKREVFTFIKDRLWSKIER